MSYGYTAYQAVDETINFTAENSSATYTFHAPWEDAISLRQFVSAVVTIDGEKQFVAGAPYYKVPGWVCNGLDIRPLKDIDGNVADWKTAVCVTKFGPPQQDEQGEDNAQETGSLSIDLSAEELVLPKEGLQANGTDLTQSQNSPNPIKVVVKGTIALNYKFRPLLAPGAYGSLIGTINSNVLFGASPGTLLYAGMQTSTSFSTDGSQTWTWGHKWDFQPNGWNNAFIDGQWQEITYSNGGGKRYEEADHSGLLA